jgi:hypothetical protein
MFSVVAQAKKKVCVSNNVIATRSGFERARTPNMFVNSQMCENSQIFL